MNSEEIMQSVPDFSDQPDIPFPFIKLTVDTSQKLLLEGGEADEKQQLSEFKISENNPKENAQYLLWYTTWSRRIEMLEVDPEPAVLLDEDLKSENCKIFEPIKELTSSDAFQFLFQPSSKNNFEENTWAEIHRDLKNWGKNSRWGRIEDKILFKLLRELETQRVTTFSEVLEISEPIHPDQEKMLTMLATKVQWKGSLINLVNRVKTLFKFNEFSVRELKLLKRLVKKQYKAKEINYEKLLEEFPGKSLESIINTSKQFIKC